MKIAEKQFLTVDNATLNYYEINNLNPNLIILHSQGVDSSTFFKVAKKLSKYYHVYLIDLYGHGKSSKIISKYHLSAIGDDIISFMDLVIKDNVTILGHGTGANIACYVAKNSRYCTKILLEDMPLLGKRKEELVHYYYYQDLLSVCHAFINQSLEVDFVYYYFVNQYYWQFSPLRVKDGKRRISQFAYSYRKRKPNRPLRVPFWPREYLEIFKGLNNYDPYFGDAVYSGSFLNDIDFISLVSSISCPIRLFSSLENKDKAGIIRGALSKDDIEIISSLNPQIVVVPFATNHNIHIKLMKEFLNELKKFIS